MANSCWTLIGQDRKSDCIEILFAPSHWSPGKSRERKVEDQWTVLSLSSHRLSPSNRLGPALEATFLSVEHAPCPVPGGGVPPAACSPTPPFWHTEMRGTSRVGGSSCLQRGPAPFSIAWPRLTITDREGYQQPGWQPRGSSSPRAKTRRLTQALSTIPNFPALKSHCAGASKPSLPGRLQPGLPGTVRGVLVSRRVSQLLVVWGLVSAACTRHLFCPRPPPPVGARRQNARSGSLLGMPGVSGLGGVPGGRASWSSPSGGGGRRRVWRGGSAWQQLAPFSGGVPRWCATALCPVSAAAAG